VKQTRFLIGKPPQEIEPCGKLIDTVDGGSDKPLNHVPKPIRDVERSGEPLVNDEASQLAG